MECQGNSVSERKGELGDQSKREDKGIRKREEKTEEQLADRQIDRNRYCERKKKTKEKIKILEQKRVSERKTIDERKGRDKTINDKRMKQKRITIQEEMW